MKDKLKDIFTRIKSLDDTDLLILLDHCCSKHNEFYSIEADITLDSMFSLQSVMTEPIKTSYINKLCLTTASSEDDRDWALVNASAIERVQAFIMAIGVEND